MRPHRGEPTPFHHQGPAWSAGSPLAGALLTRRRRHTMPRSRCLGILRRAAPAPDGCRLCRWANGSQLNRTETSGSERTGLPGTCRSPLVAAVPCRSPPLDWGEFKAPSETHETPGQSPCESSQVCRLPVLLPIPGPETDVSGPVVGTRRRRVARFAQLTPTNARFVQAKCAVEWWPSGRAIDWSGSLRGRGQLRDPAVRRLPSRAADDQRQIRLIRGAGRCHRQLVERGHG